MTRDGGIEGARRPGVSTRSPLDVCRTLNVDSESTSLYADGRGSRAISPGSEYVVAEVERIVGHTCSGRGRHRVVQTLTVRFAGYDADFDRVYSIDGDDAIAGLLESSAEVVRDYLGQHGLRLPPDLQKCLTAECAFLELESMDVPWMFSVEAVV